MRSSRYGGKTTAALKSSNVSAPALEMCVAMADSLPIDGQRSISQELSPMRWMLAVAVALNSFAAYAGVGPGPGLTGNDTGGIIAWTPDVDLIYRDIAAAHCARWNRLTGITSVHRTYGDYIGFQCIYDRRFDPRKAWVPGPY